MKIRVKVNGEWKEWEIDPSDYLLDVLRREGYLSVKRGCDTGTCGACTVLVDGFPAYSCAILAATMDGHEITTAEGIADEMEDYIKALAEEGADQCGFCSPGLMVAVYALKKEIEMGKVERSREAVRRYLIGNLCRCSGYLGQERAILKFLGVE